MKQGIKVHDMIVPVIIVQVGYESMTLEVFIAFTLTLIKILKLQNGRENKTGEARRLVCNYNNTVQKRVSGITRLN